jgi:hypothetical protein
LFTAVVISCLLARGCNAVARGKVHGNPHASAAALRRSQSSANEAFALERGDEAGRNYTAACKDYQENTWVGVSSTITESDSPSAASRGYCGYFA